MPAIWGLKPLTDSIEGDKALRLSNGVTVDLSDLNIRLDKKPAQPVLDAIVARVQAEMDDIQALADLPDDDPDKTATVAELAAQYGGRRFLDGAGNVVSRSTLFSITWENGRLAPRWTEVR